MNIIEIVNADAMAEKTEIRRIVIKNEREKQRQQEQVELEEAFYKIIEKIKQSIRLAADNGYDTCEVTIMADEYWGINYKKDMKKIVEMFKIAGYKIRWDEYSTSWTYRSNKRSYFWIEW